MNIFKWLFEKKQPTTEVKPVTDQVVDVAQANPAASDGTTAQPAVIEAAPTQTGVKDLAAAWNFVKDGIEHLGEEAKDELIALAQKYL